MKKDSSEVLAAFLIFVLAVTFSFSVGIWVNQYTINSYLFPLFEVDRVLGYWQTWFFTATWVTLLYSQFSSYVEKYEGLEKVSYSFCTMLAIYALQYLVTWGAIQITF